MNKHPGAGRVVSIDRRISLDDAQAVALGAARISLAEAAVARCRGAFSRLERVIAENRHVYGITTGFGPLANRLVHARHINTLQQNLVYHLASGVGPDMHWAMARSVVLSRLMSLLQGASGVAPETLHLMVQLLNSGLAPRLPARGTVGASGDLTPLAHMVLSFQGKGEFLLASGDVLRGAVGLEKLGVAPLDLSQRDGLALVNGTSAMTGIATLNAGDMARAVNWACATSAVMAESLSGRAEAWDPTFAALRPHPGQIAAASDLGARIAGSQRMKSGRIADRVLSDDLDQMQELEAGQDPYSLRCAPQIIGGVADVVSWHARIVETELHSVTDNPIFPESGSVPALHGGNFMGVHIALASDALSNAIAVLAGLAERQVARLTDERLNHGLPAFLSGGDLGLHSGMMGAQVTATALCAEIRTIGPASAHSISTNGANQDVVSQGTIAARLAHEKIEMLSQIQAINALAVVQAMELRLSADDTLAFSANAQSLRKYVREFSPTLLADRPLGAEIEALAKAMRRTSPPQV